MNPLGLSSEGKRPSTWGTGVKMAIHSVLRKSINRHKHLKTVLNKTTFTFTCPSKCRRYATNNLIMRYVVRYTLLSIHGAITINEI